MEREHSWLRGFNEFESMNQSHYFVLFFTRDVSTLFPVSKETVKKKLNTYNLFKMIFKTSIW